MAKEPKEHLNSALSSAVASESPRRKEPFPAYGIHQLTQNQDAVLILN